MKLIELRTELERMLSENPNARRKINTLTKLQWIESSYTFDMNCSGETDILEINDIQNILKNSIIDSKSLRDHIIVRNYYDVIRYLYDIIAVSYNLDLALIEKINIILSREGIIKKEFPKYRTEEAPFIQPFSLITPEPDFISPQMHQFIRDYGEIHGRYNPVYIGCYVHNELIRIYPFEENNEATARALLNFELISAGYLPVVFKMDREEYYEAVKLHINENDGRAFYELIMNAEKETYTKYIDLLSNGR